MRTPPRLSATVLLVLTLLLAGCGHSAPTSAPSTSRTATKAPTASPSPSAPDTGLPEPGPGAETGWQLLRRTLPSGRSYFVSVPTCTGADTCKAWLTHRRKLIISLHGAMQVEDAANARVLVNAIASVTRGDAIAVFGVSERGDRVWDADQCCTFRKVDEIGYLKDVIADVGAVTPIDPKRVGLLGVSNGGMLATKAICERPDLFKAVAVWAASWKGPCDRGPVTIGHWHGTNDTTLPVHGGTTVLLGHRITFAPADWLKGRLQPGSTFKLVIVPGGLHWPAPAWAAQVIVTWLDKQLDN